MVGDRCLPTESVALILADLKHARHNVLGNSLDEISCSLTVNKYVCRERDRENLFKSRGKHRLETVLEKGSSKAPQRLSLSGHHM